MNLSIILFVDGRTPAHYDSVPAFAEHLCDTRINPFLVETARTADANEARLEFVRVVCEPPGYASCLGIERSMEVPCASCLILQGPHLSFLRFSASAFTLIVGRGQDELNWTCTWQ